MLSIYNWHEIIMDNIYCEKNIAYIFATVLLNF